MQQQLQSSSAGSFISRAPAVLRIATEYLNKRMSIELSSLRMISNIECHINTLGHCWLEHHSSTIAIAIGLSLCICISISMSISMSRIVRSVTKV